MIKLLLADDHPLILEGTKQFLRGKQYQVVACAKDGQEAYNLILSHKPDIAILDYSMPILSGLEIAQTIKAKSIKCPIILLTLHKQEDIVKEVGKLIDAYVTKDSSMTEIEKAIEAVCRGELYISPSLKEQKLFATEKKIPASITNTELKVLKLLAKNMSSAEIAEMYSISRRTVEKHRSNLVKKLNLSSKPNALFIWIKNYPELIE